VRSRAGADLLRREPSRRDRSGVAAAGGSPIEVVVTDRLLTAREVAELLGVSASTVLDWFEARRLPGFKLNGHAVRFRESELEAWLDQQRVGAVTTVSRA
jgi:excisionase family DNA binding protein